ncbi:hypothetical protein EPO15_18065 [bacterium]|nr:MAG: hypothetical protein EPO15_18065 [bacterium]
MSFGRVRTLGTGARAASGVARLKSAVAVFLAGWIVLSPFASALAFDPNPANNQGAVALQVAPLDVYAPVPVTDLAGSSGAEGQAVVQWTAPDESHGVARKPVPVSSYDLRFATFSVAQLGGNTTAWFNAATPLPTTAPLAPGGVQTVITSLEPGTTYFLALKSVDDAANTSDVDEEAHGVAAQATVGVKGIVGVTNLTAVMGAQTGEVALSWSAPRRLGTQDPLFYEVRASSAAQISTSAEFDAAQPLTAFSPSPLPGVAAAGTAESLTLTGLVPGATYYFALRVKDSGGSPFKGVWLRNVAAGVNPFNFAQARFNGQRPEPVTDLTALPGAQVGQIRVTWTAPASPSGVPLTHYVIKASSLSVADLAGDATAWFDQPEATTTVKYGVLPAGSTEFADISFLQELGKRFYFGLKAVDMLGLASFIDLGAANGYQANSLPRPVPPIVNLTAVAVSTESGRIDLTWTSPDITGMVPPLRYDVRASTAGNIADNAEFEAAAPLTAFSPSESPAVSSATFTAMTVTGLRAGTTFYFAVRVVDSNPLGVVQSDWVRSVSSGVNVNNFAPAPRVPNVPFAVTDLSALPVGGVDSLTLSWTAPRNANFASIVSYDVRFATFSADDLGGDATAWFNVAVSSLLPTALSPGASETFTLTGLAGGELYYFGVRALDSFGEASPVDFGLDPATAPVQARARPIGIAAVTDLLALPDAVSGAVDLSWTTPNRSVTALPERFLVRVSSVGQIDDTAAFAAALPLTAFSGSPLPAVGVAGSSNAVTLTGLTPFTTYYFAVAVADASLPNNIVGRWLRDATRNVNNFTTPSFTFREPDPVSDLTSLPGALSGELTLQWTAPRNQNFVPISSYTVRAATFSPAALSGDATAWFNAATLSFVHYPASLPGARETLALSGLEPGAEYFFGLRAYDAIGTAGNLDLGLDPSHPAPIVRGRPRGLGAVTGFVAVPGAGAGAVDLSWTTPTRVLPAAPERYAVRLSTTGQIADGAAFAAASPLSAFSSSPLPSVGLAASRQTLTLTGLTPFVTYYFAVRVEDSSAPVNNVGVWLRDTLLARNTANFTVPSFFVNLPEPVTDLTARVGAQEGEVKLSWTAPRNLNLMPIVGYQVRYATFSVAALANDATSWFSAAPFSALLNTALPTGASEQLTIAGLAPASTFYFAVRSVDAVNEVSFVDTGADPVGPGVQASTRPLNLPPGLPAGFAAAAGVKRATLSWNDLPAGVTGAGKGLDFAHYRIQRSTDGGAQFVDVATTTATSYTDRPLRAETTALYRLSARDQEGRESPVVAVSTLPFTLRPVDPFGVRFDRTASSITITWGKTTRFDTLEAFYDPAAPSSDELAGYRVLRSSGGPFAQAAAYGVATTTHTEADDGNSYQYRVVSFNDFFVSRGAITFSPLGEQSIVLSDGITKLVVPAGLGDALRAGSNGLTEDIYIQSSFLTELNGGEVLQTVEFVPMLGGGTRLQNFALPQAVSIVLGFQVDGNGNPVPATAQSMGVAAQAVEAAGAAGGFGLASAPAGVTPAAAPAAADVKNLGMYWNDGKDFKKLYGTVNTTNNSVVAQTPNLGQFQVRRVFRDAAATFDISNITTRVVTPNGDGKNDVMLMLFDNPNHVAVSGKIYDLRGAFVAEMTAGLAADSLQWDGKMNGKAVTSGVYVYQVQGDGKTYNGTVVVAR